jgi:hypothetical protein
MPKVAVVGEQNHADLVIRYQSDIGRRVVEPARFVNDAYSVHVHILPRHRLSELLVETEHFTLSYLQRFAQLRITAPPPRQAVRKMARSRADENICPLPGKS